MGRGPVGNRDEALDLLHRAAARLAARLGRPALLCCEHPRIAQRIEVQKAERESFENPLASRFYGREETITLEHESVSLYELDDVWIVGEDGVAFFDPDHVLGTCHHVRAKFPKKARRPIRSLSARVDDPVFVLRGRSCENRAHFLLEHLPRYLAAEPHLEPADRVRILVSPGHRAWQQGSLEKLGVDSGRLVEASIGTTRCRKAFWLPLLTGDNQRILGPARLYHALAERLAPDPTPPQRPGVLFVSRDDAAERRLANEREVIGVFEETFGSVEVVRMSKLSAVEQISCFQGARIITGAHGQGMRNVLFARGALFLQLCEGSASRKDRRSAWEEAFLCVALMRGNRALNLYSERELDEDGHWSFPTSQLRTALGRIRELDRSL